MANKHRGEVEIDIDKKREFLKKRGTIYLHFDYNAIADAERELQGKTLFEILQLSVTTPQKISFDDTRILLAAGLKHDFPAINKDIAGRVLNEEKHTYVLGKIGEALGAAFSGTVWEAAAIEEGEGEEAEPDTPFVTSVAEDEPDAGKRGKKQ